MFKYHGWPKEVVSDRDVRLTASFWSDLQAYTGTKLNMSTANHPQTDGQTERANRTIIEALRAYVSTFQTDWEDHLVAIEFAYNDSDHAGTGYSPFFLGSGYNPLTPSAIVAGAPSARPTNTPAFLRHIQNDIGSAKAALEAANVDACRQANKTRRELILKVGDHVWLTADHIHVPQAVQARRKLAPSYYGPYTILEAVSDVAYRLDLPPKHRIHPVVHVSHLKPFAGDFDHATVRHYPAPEMIDGQEHYYVEAFVNAKTVRGHERYLVKWKGYTDDWNEWIRADYLAEDLDKKTFNKLKKELLQQLAAAPPKTTRRKKAGAT